MNFKKMLFGVVATCFLGIASFTIFTSFNKNDKEPTVNQLHANYSINVEDKAIAVGDADYVFVAEVLEKIQTEYRHPVTLETENGGSKVVKDPYTIYSVQVINNIKGNLKTTEPIEIIKSGGLSEDGKNILIYENDNLPVENNFYIMLGYAQPDGSILISGANSNIEFNMHTKSDILLSNEYNEYLDAVQNEVKSTRERYTSSFEE